jgi:hypothetical protein
LRKIVCIAGKIIIYLLIVAKTEIKNLATA